MQAIITAALPPLPPQQKPHRTYSKVEAGPPHEGDGQLAEIRVFCRVAAHNTHGVPWAMGGAEEKTGYNGKKLSRRLNKFKAARSRSIPGCNVLSNSFQSKAHRHGQTAAQTAHTP